MNLHTNLEAFRLLNDIAHFVPIFYPWNLFSNFLHQFFFLFYLPYFLIVIFFQFLLVSSDDPTSLKMCIDSSKNKQIKSLHRKKQMIKWLFLMITSQLWFIPVFFVFTFFSIVQAGPTWEIETEVSRLLKTCFWHICIIYEYNFTHSFF